MMLGEAVGYFVEMRPQLSEATLEGYEKTLGLFVVWMRAHWGDRDQDLKTITLRDMQKWYAALHAKRTRYEDNDYRPTEKGKLSDHTIDNYYRRVRAFLNWFVGRKDENGRVLLRRNPMEGMEHEPPPPALPKWLSEAQVATLLEAAERKGIREYALIRLALATGLRRRGLWNLKVGDFDFSMPDQPMVVTLEKGEQWRFVAFDPTTGAAIQAWLAIRPDRTEYLWVVTRPTKRQKLGDHLTLSGFRQVVRRVCAEAGVELGDGAGTVKFPEVGVHRMRHTAARKAFKAGVPQLIIQQQFGWRDEKSMESYIRATTDDIQEYFSVDRLPEPKSPKGRPLLKRVK